MSTIAAIATPPGRGGVGIIRISGSEAVTCARRLARRKAPWRPRLAHCCTWYDADGVPLDTGLVIYFPAPASYTGEDVVELQAHGSPVVLRALLERLYALGASPAGPGAFTRRAVENGKMDLSQAEAVAACIDAATLRAARQAQRHLQGAFGQQIQALMYELTGVVAHVEACLDFPDEDIPALLFDQLRETVARKLVHPIDQMLQRAVFGERLFNGANIAIIGAPNVGKSSLLNRLAGRDRAIVSDVAGTTRDLIEVDFDIRGIPVRLVDTAGLRLAGTDTIEHEGISRAKQVASTADVVVFVADVTRPETWSDTHAAGMRVMNKVDLRPGVPMPDGFLPVSTLTGAGLQAFTDRLASMLGDMPAGEEGLLVTRERHRRGLEEAKAGLLRGMELLGDESQLELVALEWRHSWSCLGEIVGVGDIEHVLDRIFSDFCIGK